ncbi:unnamed protein product, partial [Polarella glacialis]
ALIEVRQGASVELIDCRLQGAGLLLHGAGASAHLVRTRIAQTKGPGVTGSEFADLALEGCQVVGCAGEGVRATSGRRLNLLDCTVTDNELSGLLVDGASGIGHISGTVLRAVPSPVTDSTEPAPELDETDRGSGSASNHPRIRKPWKFYGPADFALMELKNEASADWLFLHSLATVCADSGALLTWGQNSLQNALGETGGRGHLEARGVYFKRGWRSGASFRAGDECRVWVDSRASWLPGDCEALRWVKSASCAGLISQFVSQRTLHVKVGAESGKKLAASPGLREARFSKAAFTQLFHIAESGGFSAPVLAAQVMSRVQPLVMFAAVFFAFAPGALTKLDALQWQWGKAILGCRFSKEFKRALVVAQCGWTLRLSSALMEEVAVMLARLAALPLSHPAAVMLAATANSCEHLGPQAGPAARKKLLRRYRREFVRPVLLERDRSEYIAAACKAIPGGIGAPLDWQPEPGSLPFSQLERAAGATAWMWFRCWAIIRITGRWPCPVFGFNALPQAEESE